MGILENLGLGIVFILILVFAFYFAILGLTFMLGLPQVYVRLMQELGKRLERRFPKLSENKKIREGFGFFLVFSGMAVFVGGIYLFFTFIDWLPN